MTTPNSLTIPFPLWQPYICFLSLWVLFCFVSKFICIISFQISHIRDAIWYFSFSVWLTSLNMKLSRSIHVATDGIISFFLMAEQYYIVYIDHIFFIHSSVSEHLGYFFYLQIWAFPKLACSVVFEFGKCHGQRSLAVYSPWDFPGENTGVGCHFLLQGIFLVQGSNPRLPHLLHWQADSYC